MQALGGASSGTGCWTATYTHCTTICSGGRRQTRTADKAHPRPRPLACACLTPQKQVIPPPGLIPVAASVPRTAPGPCRRPLPPPPLTPPLRRTAPAPAGAGDGTRLQQP